MSSTLIRGATILTMDRQGDLPEGDLLVQGDRIAAVLQIPQHACGGLRVGPAATKHLCKFAG